MTVVTRKFADISKRPDYYQFEFETGLRRSNDDDDLTITPKRIKVVPETVDGEAVLSVDLDPGPCRCTYRGIVHIIDVPDVAGPVDLQDLIDVGTVEQGRPEMPSNSVVLRGLGIDGFRREGTDLVSLVKNVEVARFSISDLLFEETQDQSDGILAISDFVNSWHSYPKSHYNRLRHMLWRTGVSAAGLTYVAEFDLRRRTTRKFPLHYWTEPDDHNTPALLMSDDKPPLVAVTGHSTENYIYVRVGSAPYALETLGSEISVDFGTPVTYTHLIRRPGTNTVALLTRAANNWLCKVSTDWGQTWGAVQTLWTATYASRGMSADGLFHYVLLPHPTIASQTYLRYLRLDSVTGDIRAATGPSLGNIWVGGVTSIDDSVSATTISNLGTSSLIGRRVLDTAPDGSVLFCELTKADPGVGGPIKVYRRTDLATWTLIDPGIHSGHAVGYDSSGYIGGANFGIDWRELFITRNTGYVSNSDSGTWLTERYLWDGSNYAKQETLLTRTGGKKSGRPTISENDRERSPVSTVDYDFYAQSTFTEYMGDQAVINERPTPPAALPAPSPSGVVAGILSAVPSLTALWPLDYVWRDKDASGNGHTLVTTSTTQPTFGGLSGTKGTSAADFDGVDDRLTADIAPAATFTVFGLVYRRTNTTSDVFIGSSSGTNALALYFNANNQQLIWRADQATGANKSFSSALSGNGVWHFVIFTYDSVGDTAQAWIGDPATGVLTDKGSVADTDNINASPGRLRIGVRGGGTNPFDGAMNMIGYVPRALTSGERAALMSAVTA